MRLTLLALLEVPLRITGCRTIRVGNPRGGLNGAMLFDKCNGLNALDLVHMFSKAGALPIALPWSRRGELERANP